MKTLAVLDVDGTLLAPDGSVSPRVRAAVEWAGAAGCLITLATGRRLWAVRPIVDQLGIQLPVILYNGAIVYSLEDEHEILCCRLPREAFAQSLAAIVEAGFQPVAYENPSEGERIYTGARSRDDAATRHYFDRPAVATQRVDLPLADLRSIGEPVLLAAMGSEADVTRLAERIDRKVAGCQTLIERQSFVPGSPWWQVDVTAPGVSKGNALRELCARFEIPLQNTIAVGDGSNDVELIAAAGFGIAMGNAVEAVRRAAAVIVADNAHDGAAEALERFATGPPATIASL